MAYPANRQALKKLEIANGELEMSTQLEQSFDDWVRSVPGALRSDPLWESFYYQLAMYLYDLAWLDCVRLRQDFRGREIASQLVRSAGGICANMEEAYGRGIGSADHMRILRIALGEARETQGWYFRSRHILPGDLIERRLDVIRQVISLVINSIARQRKILSNS